jgi:hypothetical protein
MRFDWYQATIPEHHLTIIDAFQSLLVPGSSVDVGRGRHNYHESFTIKDKAGDRVALVLAGGPNGYPNVTSSGLMAEKASKLIRSRWPEHAVTRMDAAEDFSDVGAFEMLEAVCRDVTKSHGVKGRAIVPDDPADGRTYYMGAPSSDVQARLYDKGAELRKKLPEARHHEVPEALTRLEVQVRPRKEWRKSAAKLTSCQVWGFSGWSSELARKAFQMELERIEMQAGRETAFERTHRYMLRQYGNHLRMLFEDFGSWDLVGRNLGEDLAKLDADNK